MVYIEIHKTLNELFVSANEMLAYLEKTSVDSQIQYVSGNYIRIEDHYEIQAYPIPVIMIKGKGEIGFNLDGVYFEFLLKKQTALRLNVENLSAAFTLEIYGAEDNEKDYYHKGMSNDVFKQAVEKSKENGFGIAVYMNAFSGNNEELYNEFDGCLKKLLMG